MWPVVTQYRTRNPPLVLAAREGVVVVVTQKKMRNPPSLMFGVREGVGCMPSLSPLVSRAVHYAIYGVWLYNYGTSTAMESL